MTTTDIPRGAIRRIRRPRHESAETVTPAEARARLAQEFETAYRNAYRAERMTGAEPMLARSRAATATTREALAVAALDTGEVRARVTREVDAVLSETPPRSIRDS